MKEHRTGGQRDTLLEIKYKMAEKPLSLRGLGEDVAEACLTYLVAASTKRNNLQIIWGRLRAVFTNPASPWHRLTFLPSPAIIGFNPPSQNSASLRAAAIPLPRGRVNYRAVSCFAGAAC